MKYKAIKIDATNRTVTQVSIDNFEDIQREIGCDTFTTAMRFDNGDSLFVDDEGLINDTKTVFKYKGGHQPFMGNGLIVGGSDETGETEDVKTGLLEAAMAVSFQIKIPSIAEAL